MYYVIKVIPSKAPKNRDRTFLGLTWSTSASCCCFFSSNHIGCMENSLIACKCGRISGRRFIFSLKRRDEQKQVCVHRLTALQKNRLLDDCSSETNNKSFWPMFQEKRKSTIGCDLLFILYEPTLVLFFFLVAINKQLDQGCLFKLTQFIHHCRKALSKDESAFTGKFEL